MTEDEMKVFQENLSVQGLFDAIMPSAKSISIEDLYQVFKKRMEEEGS